MSSATLIPPQRLGGVARYSEGSLGDATSSAPTFRIYRPEDAARARTADEPIPWDDREFEKAPRVVLRRVRLGVLRDLAQREIMTQSLFPMLVEGPPARRRLVYETLREFAEPQNIIVNSLLLYMRDGDVGPLVMGAGLLEDLGARSWPVLASYARRVRPECAYFVPAIARLKGVPAQERLAVLETLARSDDAELRWRVHEALEDFPSDDMSRVLRALAEAGDLEDPARTAADKPMRGDIAESADRVAAS
jgi:hypothetical protein